VKALKYIVLDNYFFRRVSKNISLRYVMNNEANRVLILYALHEDSRHRGQEGTY
jgi:hypothetical protein